jgi:hypothetical protein
MTLSSLSRVLTLLVLFSLCASVHCGVPGELADNTTCSAVGVNPDPFRYRVKLTSPYDDPTKVFMPVIAPCYAISLFFLSH